MKYLITGAAGFIGSNVAKALCRNKKDLVVGIDNINDYYDINLKLNRLEFLSVCANFTFKKMDISDKDELNSLFEKEKFDVVINLAAQAGVRYSIENPDVYIQSNLIGFFNILEACRNYPIRHLLYASSSSVYGGNKKIPFSTKDNVDHPVSLYAATKKSDELMAHTYSNLFNIPTTGLRFFTVYGPLGRPDMAYFSFTDKMVKGETIKIFNNGNMLRDFTYIDDIVGGIVRLIPKIPRANADWDSNDISKSWAPYQIFNIGNNSPVKLLDFISILEKNIGIKAKKEFLPMQPGDVKVTYADVSDLERVINFKPSTSLEKGIENFSNWYKKYYKI